jgi:hypothetical protein
MALTEQDRQALEKKRIADAITVANQAISKAEKYERLSQNPDWKDHLRDLESIIHMHDREIKGAEEMLVDAPSVAYVKPDSKGIPILVSSITDWANHIRLHTIQKQQIERWLKEPEHIMEMARIARENLPILEEGLKKYEEVPVGSNGR